MHLISPDFEMVEGRPAKHVGCKEIQKCVQHIAQNDGWDNLFKDVL